LFFAGLLFSKFVISISQFALLALWLVDKNFKTKITRLSKDYSTLIFLSLYLFLIIGLIWTSDWDYAFHDLKIKLPILILPLIISSSNPLSKKELNFLLFSFTVIVFAKTFESFIILLTNNFITNINILSRKISHIRLSLMINLVIFSVYHLIKDKFLHKKWQIIVSQLLIAWFILSLFVIQSLTGFVVLFIIIFFIAVQIIFRQKKLLIKILSLLFIFLLIFAVYYSIHYQIKEFFTLKDPDYKNLPQYTENGNKYYHDTTNYFIENGYKVGYFLCESELKENWNRISNVKYDSLDINGYQIKYTLSRYLTSMGLTKDSAGISKLSENDVQNIQNSIANYKHAKKISINNKIYKIIWQVHVYKNGGSPNEQSITQRIEFAKTAFNIIQDNLFFGVGTGDVKIAFKEQYVKDNSRLYEKNRYRTHNQYITLIVTLGIFFGTWCILVIFIPFIKNNKYKEFLPTVFLLITALSMFNEDTLETSISISFFAVFYSLLILQKQKTIS